MKKIILLGLGLLLSGASLQAQYYQIPNPNANTNPGGVNTDDEYPVGGGLAATWTTIHTPSASPTWSAAINLPFAFQFNGSPVTQFKVSNSGIVTFDVGTAVAAPSFTKAALPSASIPNNSICIWGLGGIGANDNVVAKTFGSAPNRQYWIQFSSYGYGTATSDGSNFCYWSIVLEETTNRIHIVDNRTGGYGAAVKVVSAGVQINSGSAIAVATSPNLVSLAGTDPTPGDNTFYTFVPGTQPAYDMTVTQITTNQYLAAGNVSVAGVIRNLGSTTITSLTMHYKIDNGTPVSAPLTGLNIAPMAVYNFTHPTPWNATIGAHTIEAYATDLNGNNPDANPGDDSKTKSVSVMSENVQRIPLFEIFSSSTCGPCKPGNENFMNVINGKPVNDFVKVKYQQDFPGTGDPYCTTEAVNRRAYYAINSIPRMEIDGGWNGNASSFTTALYDAARAVPAQFKLNGTFKIDNKSVTAKARFSPLFNAAGAKLYVAVLEHLTTQNVKSNGEVEFHDVMKKMLPNENGTALPAVTVGNWDSITVNWTFNGNYRLPQDGATANRINHASENSVEEFTDLYVIAWIQGPDKQVYQAVNLTDQTPVGTENFNETVTGIRVYPNPASDRLQVELNLESAQQIMATLVDLNGNVISSQARPMQAGKGSLSFDISQVANGVYHLMVFDGNNNSSVQKVVVSH
jgi:hypothetical protein